MLTTNRETIAPNKGVSDNTIFTFHCRLQPLQREKESAGRVRPVQRIRFADGESVVHYPGGRHVSPTMLSATHNIYTEVSVADVLHTRLPFHVLVLPRTKRPNQRAPMELRRKRLAPDHQRSAVATYSCFYGYPGYSKIPRIRGLHQTGSRRQQ